MDLEALGAALGFLFIVVPLIMLAVAILIYVLIIRAIIRYAAKQIAEENAKQQQKIFGQQANYLAARIAEEIKKEPIEEKST